MALNTGRSGQPVQNAGGRAGSSPSDAATAAKAPQADAANNAAGAETAAPWPSDAQLEALRSKLAA